MDLLKKVKPLSQLAGDVGSDDVVMLKLENASHNPVGYVWPTKGNQPKIIYPTSGLATTTLNGPIGEIVRVLEETGVNIDSGKYQRHKILGYEVLRRGKKEEPHLCNIF